MTAIHWIAKGRRIIDLSQITHVLVTEAGVTVFPMGLTLPHTDGAELIWHWVTPPWKKLCIRVINKWHTLNLKTEYQTIYNILMEAIDR